MEHDAVLERFRQDSANRRIAERLLAGGWQDKTEVAEWVGAHVNAVPGVVRQLRLAGVNVRSRGSPTTGRVSYHVRVGGHDLVTTAEVPVMEEGGESTSSDPGTSGPQRIRFVRGNMWGLVSIPGLGDLWGRITDSGDLVDLQEEPPA